MRTRLACWGTLLLVGLVVAGCKGFFTSGPTTPGTTGLVYVLNSAQGAGNVGSVSGYLASSSTGVLSQLVNSPFGTGKLNTPTSMSADASGKFVYVSSAAGAGGGPGVAGFVISSNTSTLGQLASVGAVQPAQATPTAIAVDPSARAVYAVETTSTGAAQVEAFTINTSTGVLTAQANSPYSLGVNGTPTSATVALSGGFLFVGMGTPAMPDGSIFSVPINSDGTLKIAAIVKAPPLAGVSAVAALAADPTVSFLYAVDGIQFVSFYTINSSTGALTAVAKYTAGSAPVSVGTAVVNPTTTFVFTANQGSNNVSGFIVGSGGGLTALVNSPFSVPATAQTPVALAVDPSQAFLYVVCKVSNSVLSFVIVPNNIPVLVAPGSSNPSTGQAPTAVVAVQCPLGRGHCG